MVGGIATFVLLYLNIPGLPDIPYLLRHGRHWANDICVLAPGSCIAGPHVRFSQIYRLCTMAGAGMMSLPMFDSDFLTDSDYPIR